MTKQQAEKILIRPVFGDPECIKAARRLEDEAEAKSLRKRLSAGGYFVTCGACGGEGCDVCGKRGAIEITRQLADSWEPDIVRDVFKEMGLDD
jgi:hypothetical protein